MIGRQDFLWSCPLCFFPCFAYASLLTIFVCLCVLFRSCCSHAVVFGKTLVHEFPMSYSHTEWYLLFSRGEIVCELGPKLRLSKSNQTKLPHVSAFIQVDTSLLVQVFLHTPLAPLPYLLFLSSHLKALHALHPGLILYSFAHTSKLPMLCTQALFPPLVLFTTFLSIPTFVLQY